MWAVQGLLRPVQRCTAFKVMGCKSPSVGRQLHKNWLHTLKASMGLGLGVSFVREGVSRDTGAWGQSQFEKALTVIDDTIQASGHPWQYFRCSLLPPRRWASTSSSPGKTKAKLHNGRGRVPSQATDAGRKLHVCIALRNSKNLQRPRPPELATIMFMATMNMTRFSIILFLTTGYNTVP